MARRFTFRYDILVQGGGFRGMVRDCASRGGQKPRGMPGEHHFFSITFDHHRRRRAAVTAAPARNIQKNMTVVLQHQFWDLKVTDDAFEVGLSFGGRGQNGCSCRSDAIKAFADSVGAVHAAVRRSLAGRRRTRTLREIEARKTEQTAGRAKRAETPPAGQETPMPQAFRRARCRRQRQPATRGAGVIRTSRRTKAAPKWLRARPLSAKK